MCHWAGYNAPVVCTYNAPGICTHSEPPICGYSEPPICTPEPLDPLETPQRIFILVFLMGLVREIAMVYDTFRSHIKPGTERRKIPWLEGDWKW